MFLTTKMKKAEFKEKARYVKCRGKKILDVFASRIKGRLNKISVRNDHTFIFS